MSRTVALDSVKLFIQQGIDAILNSDPEVPAIPINWLNDVVDKPRIQFAISGPAGNGLVDFGYFSLEGTRVFHVCIQVISDGDEANAITETLVSAFDSEQFGPVLEEGVFWVEGSPPLFTCAISDTLGPTDISIGPEKRILLEFDLEVTDAGAVDNPQP